MSTPFAPEQTVTIAANTTAAAVTFAAAGLSVVIYNSTASLAFVQAGAAGDVNATSASYPVPPGGRVLLGTGFPAEPGITGLYPAVSVVLASGSGSVYASIGNGTSY